MGVSRWIWKTCLKNRFVDWCKAKACKYMNCRRNRRAFAIPSFFKDCAPKTEQASISANLWNFDLSGAIKAAKEKSASAACNKVWDKKIAGKVSRWIWKT